MMSGGTYYLLEYARVPYIGVMMPKSRRRARVGYSSGVVRLQFRSMGLSAWLSWGGSLG